MRIDHAPGDQVDLGDFVEFGKCFGQIDDILGLATGVGAQVALQRSPILRTGTDNIS